MPNAKLVLSIGLAGCASAIAMPDLSLRTQPDVTLTRSPEILEELLVRYDRIHEGAARDALAQRIDKVAAQRYATVSRLYWYTDLEQAKAAAAKEDKPILALRMLGNLDEDLSCANSRFFRATLYANKELSAYMKQNFILHWSSERAVPKVTIDFGDGRTIQSTTTGNSAHYILDEKGEVMDVIPGLYTPDAFRSELSVGLAHARDVAAAPAHERGAKIIGYHKARLALLSSAASKLNVYALRGKRVDAGEAASLAQRATISKAFVEVPQLRQITSTELTSIREDEVDTWAHFAEQTWPGARSAEQAYMQMRFPRDAAQTDWATVFDTQSTELVARLYGDATEQQRRSMLARLARSARADSALNQLRLRPQIHRFLAKGSTDFTTINDFIYASVFHTPKSDPWLGLHARRDFTGLPDDGVTAPTATAHR